MYISYDPEKQKCRKNLNIHQNLMLLISQHNLSYILVTNEP